MNKITIHPVGYVLLVAVVFALLSVFTLVQAQEGGGGSSGSSEGGVVSGMADGHGYTSGAIDDEGHVAGSVDDEGHTPGAVDDEGHTYGAVDDEGHVYGSVDDAGHIAGYNESSQTAATILDDVTALGSGSESAVTQDSSYAAAVDDVRDSYNDAVSAAQSAGTSNVTANEVLALEIIREQRFNRSCHEITTQQTQGFGLAYNVNSPNQQLAVAAACDTATPDVLLAAGANNTGTYVYRKAYSYNAGVGSWQSQTLQPAPGSQVVGDWILGEALGEVEVGVSNANNRTYLAAYTCEYINGSWNCGCTDAQCSSSAWQLQSVPPFAPTAAGVNPNNTTSNNNSNNSTQAQTVTVDIRSSNFEFDVNDITVNEGDTVVINLTNDEGVHDWTINEFDAQTETLDNPGDTDSISFVADEAGTFEFFCSVPGHRQLGMVGTLTVE